MKPFIDSNQLVMLGLIQEQHADRCLLFQQWKGLDFPVVQDAINANGIKEVPVYIAIDEHGIVRSRPRRPKGFASEFIEKTFVASAESADIADSRTINPEYWQAKVDQTASVKNLLGLADSLVVWDDDIAKTQRAIELYSQGSQQQPERGDIRFRMGVANRMLYELSQRTDSEYFARAVSNWESALRLRPNQYIYRRRIEQYGPRLKKPYSFYDWINKARTDIVARGDSPQKLQVEPNGAEFAHRAKQMKVDKSSQNPDPQNRITRDRDFVQTHINFVPSRPGPGDVVAVHVGFSVSRTAKWNHETSPLSLWVSGSENNVLLSSQLITDETQYTTPESKEPLSISFEMQIPADQKNDIELTAFALFNICESERGQCLFRRRDFTITVPISPK